MDADQKSFSWLNTLLIIATVLTLALVIAAAYKGWKEDEAFYYSGGDSPGIIVHKGSGLAIIHFI